ncbi:MAG: 2-oxoglutarate dehydrogenase complex dihydrolipoyllysine-residue succinyltransferase [Thiohalomonadales bacterium]
MLIEVKVPILSESIAEATLVAWRKKAGEFVAEDENLVDLETDKVVLEVVAPKGGIISEIRKGDGVTVGSDEVIAIIDTTAKNDISLPATSAAAAIFESDTIKDQSVVLGNEAAVNVASAAEERRKQPHLSPAVRKLVAENEIDPQAISGTGKDGRITKGDVLGRIAAKKEQRDSVAASRPPVDPAEIDHTRYEKRVPMTRLRAKVAERLKEAQNTAAILTTFNEIDMQAIMDLRSSHQADFQKRHGVKLGFMSFFVKACVEAIKQFPIINATVDGKDIIYHGYYDFGIAIGSPRGLVVPVLRDVDKSSFANIEQAIVNYGEKAKSGKLTLDDLTGGTFSISNGGIYGSMLSTPILNPPQSAILGMHNIQQRAMVIDGEIVARPMMFLALSYDHRIIDGKDAVMFLVEIKKALEDPLRLLLEL